MTNRPKIKLKRILREIRSDLEAVEKQEALYQEASFADRAKAIDWIELHVMDRIEGLLLTSGQGEELAALKRRAEGVERGLEEIDEQLFQRLRAGIRSGHYSGADLKRQLDKYVGRAVGEKGQEEAGYDSLDAFVNGLLRIDVAPQEAREREPEMVFYQPTPARIILELAEKANTNKDDVFYDLGSGLGQVPILIHLLTGVRAVGVEFEPAYCDYAQRCARMLNLSRVAFINVDARQADYSDGTLFFMYTPFEGRMLQDVLGKLRTESQQRTIWIYTYGPCTPQVSSQRWLERIDRGASHEYRLAIFRSI
jgi:hypothetical protein